MTPNPKHSHHRERDDSYSATSTTTTTTRTATTLRKKSAREQRHRQQQLPSSQSLQSYIPAYLRPFVLPYHGDFCYTPSFHPRLVAQLMVEGFLPIATEGVLLPKLHEHRCVVTLPDRLHVSKSTRKKAKGFTISFNQAFEEVVEGCRAQHGPQCWLYPSLVQAFITIANNGHGMRVPIIHSDGEQQRASPLESTGKTCTIHLYSVEIWNNDRQLVGGELGYTVGSVYTSLTGFSAQDSAGSVQLAALGHLLCQLGFTLWDLGMEMEYKRNLGSQLVPRAVFVDAIHRAREETRERRLLTVQAREGSCNVDNTDPLPYDNARMIIDGGRRKHTDGNTKYGVADQWNAMKGISVTAAARKADETTSQLSATTRLCPTNSSHSATE